MKVVYQGEEFKVKRKAKYIAADNDGDIFTYTEKPSRKIWGYSGEEDYSEYVGYLPAGKFEPGDMPLMKIKITASLEEVKT